MVLEAVKIPQRGSIKKVGLLYASAIFAHSFPKYKGGAKLNENEVQVIWSMLKTDSQAKELTKYHNITKAIEKFCRYIQELDIKLSGDINVLYAYALLLDAYMVHSTVFVEILEQVRQAGDTNLFQKIVDTIITAAPPHATFQSDEEKGVLVNIQRTEVPEQRGGISLHGAIMEWVKKASITTVLAKSAIEAIRQVMDEEGLRINPVRLLLADCDRKLKEKWDGVPKHLNDYLLQVPEMPGVALPDVMFLCPDYSQIMANPKEVAEIVSNLKKATYEPEETK